MQYNHILGEKKLRKASLNLYIKTFVFAFVAIYIGYVIENKEQFNRDFRQNLVSLFISYHYWLTIPLSLFFANWALEALKWQFLVRKLENISFLKAFRGILTGIALGLATPFSIGDYAGRIFQLNHPERERAIGAVFISRISQFYITLLFGIYALVYFFSFVRYSDSFLYRILFFSGIMMLLFSAALIFFHQSLFKYVQKIALFKRIEIYFEIISRYSRKELLFVIGLSFLRYSIFTIQFILLLYFFGISADVLLLLAGASFVFLVKSVVPTFFDLGVRESAAVYFFTAAGCASGKIIFASLSLWAINILLPALIGLFLIFRLKIFPSS